MIYGFPPVADERSVVLILGTMPSVRSLDKAQYYGHPQNAFWRILFALWREDAPEDYKQRKAFLLDKGVALWDVLSGCEREGSADAAITEPVPNEFSYLKNVCPELKAVFFNSANAASFYKKLVNPDPFCDLHKETLPSTSPARAMTFEKKLDAWKSVYNYLTYQE